MPTYMDVHKVTNVTAGEVAEARARVIGTQDRYDVRYLRYWVAEEEGKVFWLVDAPSAEAAATVHRIAHGVEANEIYRVEEGI